MSGAVSSSKSRSRSRSASNIDFPGPFLGEFQERFGRGLTLDEVYGALPQAQSLFGASPGVSYGGEVAGGGVRANPGASGQANMGLTEQAPGTTSLNAITRRIDANWSDRPRLAATYAGDVRKWATAQGYNPDAIPLDALNKYVGGGDGFVRNILPGQLQEFPLGPARFRDPGTQMDLSALQIPESIQRLFGAGAQGRVATPQEIRSPLMTGATSQAQLANIAPGGFDKYEQSLFRSLYDPQAREAQRQGAISDRRLQSDLAGAGLASSGSGIGQLEQQRTSRAVDLRNLAADASQQATVARFGQEYAQEQFNARQRQETALSNAGFDQQARTTNASNVLAGDIARSKHYLETIGLNEDTAHAMRTDFLALLGLTQKELERMEESQKSKVGMMLDNWLAQGGLLGNLGQQSSSYSAADSKSTSVSGSAK